MNTRSKFIGMDFLVLFQSILFAILFAIWSLPNTISIRNGCLVLGCCIGIYQIYTYSAFLTNKKAIPIYLLLGLFIWATIHLLFLSNNFTLQYAEYRSIWKRSFLGAVFALGFALAIANTSSKTRQIAWIIFYIGLLLPTLIYIFKFGLLYYEKVSGLGVDPYWHMYVAKTAYVGFCTPVLAVALGQIYCQMRVEKSLTWPNLVYLLTIPLVLFVFYSENIKNGILYSLILILIFIGLITYRCLKNSPVRIGVLLAIVMFGSALFIKPHIEQNHSWQNVLADAKVALQTEHIDAWRVCGSARPINDLGKEVSDTVYSRIAWAISAFKLIPQYPMGYGLVESSFGHIGNKIWQDSCLNQSHSGWLDLTLGIGIPGMLLILTALVGVLANLILLHPRPELNYERWNSMSICALLCFLLIWITTEISQKIFFDELIFFIAFAGGLLAGKSRTS